MLKNMIDEKLVDYVAMDIKNAPSSYEKTAGAKVDLAEVIRSVNFLKLESFLMNFAPLWLPSITQPKR